jgi:D-alanine-D-alanine ligase
MRVLVLHGEVPETAPNDELDTLVQAEQVEGSLRRLGHETVRGLIRLDLERSMAEWRAARPDLVFSLVESIAGRTELAPIAYHVVDGLGLPYAGNPLSALVATTDKLLAKSVLRAAGVRTAESFTRAALARLPADRDLDGDFIVKPLCLDGSLGIRDDSRVASATAGRLLALVETRERELGVPFFAERFLAGAEFRVAMLCGEGDAPVQILPPRRITYPASAPGSLPVDGSIVGGERRAASFLTYAMEWDDVHPDWTGVDFTFVDAGDPVAAALDELALRCWEAMGLAGWARVDVRLDREGGVPMVMEVNCNPGIGPNTAFVSAAERAGIGFDEMIRRIVADAMARRRA